MKLYNSISSVLVATIFLFVCFCGVSSTSLFAANNLRIMTCNVRVTGLPSDTKYPERVWENRRDFCVKTIKSKHPDIFCLQETIYDSYEYFKKKFKGYHSFGFEGPEMDPYTEGYHYISKNVIFFRESKFEIVAEGTYWLSDTPLIAGSISWESKRARHCNWVRLKDKKTGKEFRVLNIHLDHKKEAAKLEQMKLIMQESAQYAIPQIICGDFNSGIDNLPILYVREQKGWKEMYEDIHGVDEAGFTYHGFRGETYKPKKKNNHRIDFIFYNEGKNTSIEVQEASIIKDYKPTKTLDKVVKMYPSDHYFLMADFQLN